MTEIVSRDVQRQLEEIRGALAELECGLLLASRDALDAKTIAKDDQDSLKPIIATFNAGKMMGKIFFVIGGIASGVAAMYAGLTVWFTGHIK